MRRRSERKAKAPEESTAKSSRKSTRHSEPLEVQVQDIELPVGESSSSITNDGVADVPLPQSEELGKHRSTETLVTEETGQGSDESSLWKVQSSNGDGGEIQKLKICRQKPTESPEIGDTALRKRLGRGAKDGRSTDDSTHEESEKESKRKHRSRTSSKNSPLVSPSVVCDISEGSPTKIKIINVSNVTMDKEPTNTEAVENSVNTSDEVNKEEISENQSSEISEIALPVVEAGPNEPEASEPNQIVNEKPPKSDPSLEKECKQVMRPKVKEPAQIKAEEPKENNDFKQSTPSRDRSSSSESGSSQSSSKPKKMKKRRRDMQSTVQRKVNPAVNLKNDTSDSEDASQKMAAVGGPYEASKEEDTENKENQSDSQPANDDTTAPEEAVPLVRKRRWGSSSKSKRPGDKVVLQISTDILKNLIPDVKPVAAEELQLSIEEDEEGQLNDDEDDDDIVVMVAKEEEAQLDQERHQEEKQQEKDLNEKKKRQERQERFEKVKKEYEAKKSELAATRKVKIVSNDEKKLAHHPSPPRRKANSVLYITHLVRPFTVQQLKNLLLRTGTIVENGFWIDKIKSKCYVEYETEDMAVETRHALHSVRWPTSNPKTLSVEFATRDDLLMAQAISEEPDVPRKSEPLDMVEGWVQEQARMKDRNKRIVREWDVGKPEHPEEALLEYELKAKEKEKRDLERKSRKERHHRSPSVEMEPVRKARRKEEDAPAKLLDDLFRKTKASPCIYWLPLTPEQIAVKEEIRRQHMAEHERRMAEIKKVDMARRERERRSRK